MSISITCFHYTCMYYITAQLVYIITITVHLLSHCYYILYIHLYYVIFHSFNLAAALFNALYSTYLSTHIQISDDNCFTVTMHTTVKSLTYSSVLDIPWVERSSSGLGLGLDFSIFLSLIVQWCDHRAILFYKMMLSKLISPCDSWLKITELVTQLLTQFVAFEVWLFPCHFAHILW